MADDDVVTALEKAVANDPSSVALRLHLAELRLAGGDPARALELAAGAAGLEPDNAAVRDLVTRASAALAGPAVPGPALASPVLAGPALTSAALTTTAGANAEPLAEVVPLFGVPSDSAWSVERPSLVLDDVGGLEHVKQRLRTSFLAPLRNPALRRMYAKSLRGGLLLWGPPGCGKTFIARAIAGELGARFLPVGLDDVLGIYKGESELNLHSIFETARRSAPCVLFIDEVDALGHKRSQLRGSSGRDLVVQLLQELDGVDTLNEGLFVLAATNQPWDVDPALRRPGRFDRMLLVLPPDTAARAAILRYHLRERPLADDIDVELLAEASDELSGADLALVCEDAAERGLNRALETGQATPIGMADLRAALAEVTPSARAWMHLAKTHAQFSGEGGSYDELLAYLRGRA